MGSKKNGGMNNALTPNDAWAQAKLATLIKTCTERAAIVLSWADEILDTWY